MSIQSDRVDRAIAHMMLHHPWWSSLLLNLRRSYGPVGTMCTDGTRLIIDETFVASLSGNEIEAVLMHEVSHCVLLHMFRRKGRDKIKWNIAADACANALLEADNITLPPGCVPAAALDLTAEEVYDTIRSQELHMHDLQDGGSLGDKDDGGSPMTENQWRQTVSSMRGIVPAGIMRNIDDSMDDKHDWKSDLAIWASATIKSADRTWVRPSRRHSPAPGHKRDPQTKITVCIDTSGSVDDKLLSMFAAEVRSLCAVQGIEAYIIACDAAVHAIYAPGEEWQYLPGGGGTDFRPALQKSEELEVDGCIYFTDGYGEYGQEISLPVIWAMSTANNAPWGTTIRIEGE